MSQKTTASGYQNLVVWQKSIELVVAMYAITEKFPHTEQYGLSSQMRRCAVSITSNIAEGSKRDTKTDFRHFLTMALGSGAELETQLEITKRLTYMDQKSFESIGQLLEEVMRMLPALKLHVPNARD